MKMRSFTIDNSHLPDGPSPNHQTLNVPGLSAYAIEHADLQYNGVTHAVDGNDLKIAEDSIIATSMQFSKYDSLRLCIYYFGIKDFSLLFPQIKAAAVDRAERLGLIYEEAEKTFEAGAWLSFMLMCGSIFEHLLFFRL